MFFHSHCSRDRRTRIYCPVCRILQSSGVRQPELLIGNTEYQTVIHYLGDYTAMPPGSSLLLDFGEALHGGIRLNLLYGPGRLHVRFGESVSEAIGSPDLDSSLRDADLETATCGMLEYGNTVFRFVQIQNTGDVELSFQNIMAVALECDIPVTGSFQSSDERLNQIWKTAVRTVHLCMQDYIYDGAKRDRIVWMGDMHPEIHGILCAFSDTSIIRDSLEFLIRQAPADEPMNQIYTYSCWFIISVWDYYMRTGNLEFLKKHREYFRLMLKTYQHFIREDGSEIVPERRFLDWPNNDISAAKHAGIQALMVWMMSSGAKILRELGEDDSDIRRAEALLRQHIPDPAGRKAPAALMTLTGLADCGEVLAQHPFSDVSTFYGFYMLQAKPTVPALDLIRRYWGGMLDLGATSFWEDFDLDWTKNASGIDSLPVPGKADIHADFGRYCYKGLRHSLSHGWSCGPAPFLSSRILGADFLTPGGRSIAVHPDLGDLKFVRGEVPTPYGVVGIEAEASGTCRITAPDGMDIQGPEHCEVIRV